MQATAADVSPRRSRVPRLIRGLLATAGLVLVAVIAAVSGTGVSWAFWNGTVPSSAATVQTGTIDLRVQGQSSYAIPGMSTTALLPGRSAVSQPMTVSNAGRVPLSVAWTSTEPVTSSAVLRDNLAISVRQAQNGVCAATDAALPLPTTMPPFRLARNASLQVCVEIRMLSTAPSSVQGHSAAVAIGLTGTQVRP